MHIPNKSVIFTPVEGGRNGTSKALLKNVKDFFIPNILPIFALVKEKTTDKMERNITNKELSEIAEKHLDLGKRLLKEIKHIVGQQPGKAVRVFDNVRDNMYAVVGYLDSETREEHITDLSIGERGELVLTTIGGNTLTEDNVAYRTDTYLDMLSVLHEYTFGD